jgi:glycerophosphoryl diester phosphodiesterase
MDTSRNNVRAPWVFEIRLALSTRQRVSAPDYRAVAMSYRMTRHPQLVAHMGYSAVEPANTVRAALAAIEAGADMIEIDVSITSDGHAVAIHGPRLETTTTGSGKIASTPLGALRDFTVKHRGNAVDGCRVPMVVEIVEAAGETALNFDLKTGAALDAVLDLISENGLADRSVISGVTAFRVRRIRRRKAGVTVLVNLDRLDKRLAPTRVGKRWLGWRYRRVLRHSDVLALNIHHRFVDLSLVSAIHEIGAQVWTFTVDNQLDIDRVVAAGVDSVTTNRPGEVELSQSDL